MKWKILTLVLACCGCGHQVSQSTGGSSAAASSAGPSASSSSSTSLGATSASTATSASSTSSTSGGGSTGSSPGVDAGPGGGTGSTGGSGSSPSASSGATSSTGGSSGSGSGSCPYGETLCPGTAGCTNLGYDPNNCGACGNSCALAEICDDGCQSGATCGPSVQTCGAVCCLPGQTCNADRTCVGQVECGDGGAWLNAGTACTADEDCCGGTCTSGGFCEPNCQSDADCPEPWTKCSAGVCTLVLCGGGTGNGQYNSSCTVETPGDGTCISGYYFIEMSATTLPDGGYAGLCTLGGALPTEAYCGPIYTRPASGLCVTGDICIMDNPGGKEANYCLPTCDATAADAGCPSGTECQPYVGYGAQPGFTACLAPCFSCD